jgi:multiple sugar transport system permease protein
MAVAARTQHQKEIRRHIWIYAAITPYVIIAIFPIYWMALTALKQDPDLYRMDQFPLWFHLPPTLKHFSYLFYSTNYGAWIVNTMSIAVWVAIITLLIAVPAGYALARLRIPGAENLGIAVFMTYLVPGIILFIPLARVVAMLGLQDSWWALVLVYPTITIPFCTWLLMGYFRSVPVELEEAARVDGCNRIGALVRIVLPMSLPALVVVTFFSFTHAWNEFLYAHVFTSTTGARTVTTGLVNFMSQDVFFWGPLMASTVMSALPPVLMFLVFQRWVVKGLTLGGVKG